MVSYSAVPIRAMTAVSVFDAVGPVFPTTGPPPNTPPRPPRPPRTGGGAAFSSSKGDDRMRPPGTRPCTVKLRCVLDTGRLVPNASEIVNGLSTQVLNRKAG